MSNHNNKQFSKRADLLDSAANARHTQGALNTIALGTTGLAGALGLYQIYKSLQEEGAQDKLQETNEKFQEKLKHLSSGTTEKFKNLGAYVTPSAYYQDQNQGQEITEEGQTKYSSEDSSWITSIPDAWSSISGKPQDTDKGYTFGNTATPWMFLALPTLAAGGYQFKSLLDRMYDTPNKKKQELNRVKEKYNAILERERRLKEEEEEGQRKFSSAEDPSVTSTSCLIESRVRATENLLNNYFNDHDSFTKESGIMDVLSRWAVPLGIATAGVSGLATYRNLHNSDPNRIKAEAAKEAYRRYKRLKKPRVQTVLVNSEEEAKKVDKLDNATRNLIPIRVGGQKQEEEQKEKAKGRSQDPFDYDPVDGSIKQSSVVESLPNTKSMIADLEKQAQDYGTTLDDAFGQFNQLSDSDKATIIFASAIKQAHEIDKATELVKSAAPNFNLNPQQYANLLENDNYFSNQIWDKMGRNVEARRMVQAETPEQFRTKMLQRLRQGGIGSSTVSDKLNSQIQGSNLLDDNQRQYLQQYAQNPDENNFSTTGLMARGLPTYASNFMSNISPAQWTGLGASGIAALSGRPWLGALGGLASVFGKPAYNWISQQDWARPHMQQMGLPTANQNQNPWMSMITNQSGQSQQNNLQLEPNFEAAGQEASQQGHYGNNIGSAAIQGTQDFQDKYIDPALGWYPGYKAGNYAGTKLGDWTQSGLNYLNSN